MTIKKKRITRSLSGNPLSPFIIILYEFLISLQYLYATRCYENGVDQQVVQKLLVHSTLAMTTDLYTHVSEEKKKEEVAELKILA